MTNDGLPPPPPSPAPPSGPAPAPARDRAPVVVIAVVVLLVVAIVVGLVVFLADDDERDTTAAPGSTTEDTTLTYRLRVTDDADPSEDFPEGFQVEMSTTLRISPLDAGTPGSSAEVLVGDVEGGVDGEPIPIAVARSQTVRLDDRGQPDALLIAGGDGTGTFFYFVDVLFPVVPPGADAGGDTWPIAFDAGLPTAAGTATYEGTGELVGFEDVGGVEAARVRNELTFEYDLTMDVSENAAFSGLGSMSSGTIRLTGSGTLTVTGWIDPTTRRVLRVEEEGRYDVVFAYRDLDRTELGIADSDLPSSGSFTSTLELDSAP